MIEVRRRWIPNHGGRWRFEFRGWFDPKLTDEDRKNWILWETAKGTLAALDLPLVGEPIIQAVDEIPCAFAPSTQWQLVCVAGEPMDQPEDYEDPEEWERTGCRRLRGDPCNRCRTSSHPSGGYDRR